jgi:hypothetical protein
VSETRPQHLILGGTIKAATSSLFTYISAHPQVCGSKVKETWFFSTQFTGDPELDLANYDAFFSPTGENSVLFEASPEYLTSEANVAQRIRQLLPEAKLLFVLRNPVDRLYSHFNFARGQLQLPDDLSFERFVEYCEQYNNGEITVEESGIARKHLRALDIGNYSRYLANFYDNFEALRIKVIFYDELSSKPLEKLAEISEFAGISPAFFDGLTMDRSNVSFSSRLKFLHQSAMFFNRKLEPHLRRYPALKHRLVRLYKIFNQDRRAVAAMQEATREKLNGYYAPSNAEIRKLLGNQEMPPWIT